MNRFVKVGFVLAAVAMKKLQKIYMMLFIARSMHKWLDHLPKLLLNTA